MNHGLLVGKPIIYAITLIQQSNFDIIGLKWGCYLSESQYYCGPCIKAPMQKDSRCYLKQKIKNKKNIILLCLRTRTNMLWYRRWNFPWLCYVLYQFLSYILIFQKGLTSSPFLFLFLCVLFLRIFLFHVSAF